MTGSSMDDELLSAYLDGELDAAEAARLAQRIASDDALAQRVAALAEVRSALAALAQEVVVVTVPQRRNFLPAFLAGTLIGCLGLLTVALPLVREVSNRQDQSLVDSVALHDAWTTSVTALGAPPVDKPGRGLFGAEMAMAGLTPAFLHDITGPQGQPGLHAGFVGQKGCRVSIFRLTAPPESVAGFLISSDGAVQTAVWQDHAFAYRLVARGMDETRFILLTDMLRTRADPDFGAPDPEAIAALSGPYATCRV